MSHLVNESPYVILAGFMMCLVALLLTWVVITEHMKLALGVEWGLALVAIAFGSAGYSAMVGEQCSEGPFLFRSMLMCGGMLMIAGSITVKALRQHHPLRRLEDIKALTMRGGVMK